MALIKTTRRGKPYYIVRYGYHTDQHGKQRYKTKGFTTRKAATQFETEATNHDTPTSVTINQLADAFLADHVPLLAKRTQSHYKGTLKLHIKPFLGTLQAAKLTPLHVKRWQQSLTVEHGRSAATANKALRTLKSLMRWARQSGLTTNRAVDDTRSLPQPKPKPARPYTPQEVAKLASACEYLRDATLVTLGAYSGLRFSELRALEWDDIDMEAGRIHLVRALDEDGTTKPLKTQGQREVPILAPGREALAEWRKHAPRTSLVFPSPTGEPLHNWYRDIQPGIRKHSGIKDFTPHQLRDTYASLLIDAGVGEAALSMWLGHASIQTTLRHYAQLYDRRRDHVVAQVDAALEQLVK